MDISEFNTPDGPPDAANSEYFIQKRLLWSSSRGPDAQDFYADKLWLLQIDDGLWALQLECGGTVNRMPIKNIEKYV